MLCLALSLSACKVLKTHIVKVTSSTEAQPHEVFEPYRVCRRVNILRDYPDDKIKIYP